MTEITLLDGSIGQELVKRSGDRATPLWSTSVMIDHPDLVRQVHDIYFDMGATVATTNTYAVLRDRLSRLANLEGRVEELTDTALAAARDARDQAMRDLPLPVKMPPTCFRIRSLCSPQIYTTQTSRIK